VDSLADSIKPAEIVGIDSLREWSLSQVLRLILDDGRTLIAKRGIPTKCPTELEIYQECLIPLGIDAPTLFESHTADFEYVLLLEDLKGIDLEKQPSRTSFLDAACKLAEIRSASERIEKIGASIFHKHLLTKDQLLRELDYVLEHAGSEHREMVNALRGEIRSFAEHLDRLYRDYPLTLNHNDYHGKNLLNVDGHIVPIDWANARISPHIGDLYCLIEEAKDQHIPKAAVVDAYKAALRNLGAQEEVTGWHLDVGGLCWSIHCLQWILEFGLEAIPVSRDWVPNFLTDMCAMASRLSSSQAA